MHTDESPRRRSGRRPYGNTPTDAADGFTDLLDVKAARDRPVSCDTSWRPSGERDAAAFDAAVDRRQAEVAVPKPSAAEIDAGARALADVFGAAGGGWKFYCRHAEAALIAAAYVRRRRGRSVR